MTKWTLMKVSDGKRGAEGKTKVYKIVVNGTALHTAWGKAEKAHLQTALQTLPSEGAALQAAMRKLYEKLDRGYVVTSAE